MTDPIGVAANAKRPALKLTGAGGGMMRPKQRSAEERAVGHPCGAGKLCVLRSLDGTAWVPYGSSVFVHNQSVLIIAPKPS